MNNLYSNACHEGTQKPLHIPTLGAGALHERARAMCRNAYNQRNVNHLVRIDINSGLNHCKAKFEVLMHVPGCNFTRLHKMYVKSKINEAPVKQYMSRETHKPLHIPTGGRVAQQAGVKRRSIEDMRGRPMGEGGGGSGPAIIFLQSSISN